MKTIITQFLLVISFAVFLFSCEEDDNINFIAQPPSEGIEFTSNLSSTYLLSNATSSNIAERLVWNPVDFGVPTVVTYTLESSIDNTAFEEESSSTETNAAITVNTLLDFADDLGLDNDPGTTDDTGNPNNTGQVYFRVIANPGNGDAANAPTAISEVITLNIEVIEIEEDVEPGGSPIAVSAFGLVGDVINEFGDNGLDIPLYTRGDGVHFAAINNPGVGSQFKIRENNDWGLPNFGPGDTPGSITSDSGLDNFIFPDAAILVISVDFNNATISVEAGDSWGVIGDNINGFDASGGPDIRMTEDPEQPGLWFALSIELPQTQAKFRLNNDWSNNLGPDGQGGLTPGGLDNFQVDAGTYDIFLDLRIPGMEAGGFGEPGSFEDLSEIAGGGDDPMQPEPIAVSAFGLVGDVINEFGDNGLDIPLYTRGDGVHFAAINNPGAGSQFKIRENNDWGLPNFGPGDTPGSITSDSGLDNFIFPDAAILLISVDFNSSTISVEAGDSWGVIGDNINGFDASGGPDIRMTEDPEQPGLWFALSIELPQTQAKFRLNNDWSNNLGPDGQGGLTPGGLDNFQVEAGTYDITLDLRTSGSESGGFERQ